MTRRERMLDVLARAKYERTSETASYATGVRVPDWDDLAEIWREPWQREALLEVDAVLSVPCDCAERLDREADKAHEEGRYTTAYGHSVAALFLRGES